MTTDLDEAEAHLDSADTFAERTAEREFIRGLRSIIRHLRNSPAEGKAEQPTNRCAGGLHSGILSENGMHCRHCGKQLDGPGAPVATDSLVMGDGKAERGEGPSDEKRRGFDVMPEQDVAEAWFLEVNFDGYGYRPDEVFATEELATAALRAFRGGGIAGARVRKWTVYEDGQQSRIDERERAVSE